MCGAQYGVLIFCIFGVTWTHIHIIMKSFILHFKLALLKCFLICNLDFGLHFLFGVIGGFSRAGAFSHLDSLLCFTFLD